MPKYINDSGLTFNGPVSTATQFSEATSTLVPSNGSVGFYFPIVVSSVGHLGITLQLNPDPFGESDFGWQDFATADTTIQNLADQTVLAQTDAAIASGNRRGGIIDATGTYNLYVPFSPKAYSYRLKFEFDASFQATVSKISFSTGQ